MKTAKKLYLVPNTTMVSIQYNAVCKVSSVSGGDVGLGGDSGGAIIPM